jgi:hypothetical protein
VLARELLAHWCTGVGRELHQHRRQALERLLIVDDIEAAQTAIRVEAGRSPQLWATSARPDAATLSHGDAHTRLLNQVGREAAPHLLLLGTAWGLAPSVLDICTEVLAPIVGVSGYNHLSVRCAAAILVDRLVGRSQLE